MTISAPTLNAKGSWRSRELSNCWPVGSHPVYQKIRQSGIRTFLLSNTNAIHVAEFEQMIAHTMDFELFKSAFEKIYYSNAIGIKKPHPETFLQVCEWNGLNPAETLFIDDSAQHVEGALQAGLHAYHLKPGERISELLKQLS
jgi:FMN phosphatase YigB (HAD superfamily)